jgi:hypothetical protein
MIDVLFQREVPYPPERVLSQYFDLEHLEHVHPRTFGKARMCSQIGRTIVWELEWPPILGLKILRTTISQEYVPPFSIRSRFTKGVLRSTETVVDLTPTATGTMVEERHRVPLPDWPGVSEWVRRTWLKRLHQIWDEDLKVKVCFGGWPGVPDELSDKLPACR